MTFNLQCAFWPNIGPDLAQYWAKAYFSSYLYEIHTNYGLLVKMNE